MIKVYNLEKTDSVFNQFMAELRDATIQQDVCVFAATSSASAKSWPTKSARPLNTKRKR